MISKHVKMVGYIVISLALAVAFQSCATQDLTGALSDETLLSHEELVNLFSIPREAQHSNYKGTGIIKFNPDGVQTIVKGDFSDTGRYRIEGDIICGKWKKARAGKEACSRIYKTSEKTYQLIYTDGKNGGILKFK